MKISDPITRGNRVGNFGAGPSGIQRTPRIDLAPPLEVQETVNVERPSYFKNLTIYEGFRSRFFPSLRELNVYAHKMTLTERRLMMLVTREGRNRGRVFAIILNKTAFFNYLIAGFLRNADLPWYELVPPSYIKPVRFVS